ncbi:MAG: class I SAM-dependent methyltransferase [Pseudomonadota bacterium]
MNTPDPVQAQSHEYYARNADLYAKVIYDFYDDVYTDISHPGFTNDRDLIRMVQSLVPKGARGLDAGCGAGARDVFSYYQAGYDISGVDAVAENIAVAKREHPEITDRVAVSDLTAPLNFADNYFDFVTCNTVIQHINPDLVMQHVLPEFTRVLKKGGILQLMFKSGQGTLQHYDDLFKADRTFYLYDPDELLAALQPQGFVLIEEQLDIENAPLLGGMVYFTDPRSIRNCAFWVQKI